MTWTVIELLAGPLSLAAVLVGYLIGRRDPYQFVQPYAPIGTTMPTDIKEVGGVL